MSDTDQLPETLRNGTAPSPAPEAYSPAALATGTHTRERINHLFRRSLTASRVHPLHAALLQHRGLAP